MTWNCLPYPGFARLHGPLSPFDHHHPPRRKRREGVGATDKSEVSQRQWLGLKEQQFTPFQFTPGALCTKGTWVSERDPVLRWVTWNEIELNYRLVLEAILFYRNDKLFILIQLIQFIFNAAAQEDSRKKSSLEWSSSPKINLQFESILFCLCELNKKKLKDLVRKQISNFLRRLFMGFFCPTLFTLFLGIALVSKDIICSNSALLLIIKRSKHGLWIDISLKLFERLLTRPEDNDGMPVRSLGKRWLTGHLFLGWLQSIVQLLLLLLSLLLTVVRSGDEALLLKYLQAAEEVACLSLQVASFAIPLSVPSLAYVIVVVIVGWN